MVTKMICFFFLLLWIVFFTHTSHSQHDEYLNEKRGSIVKGIKNKPDLTGMDKDAIRMKFGYPVNISTNKVNPEQTEEIWIYRPFEFGSYHLTIKFKGDKVIDYEYRELYEDKKDHDDSVQD